MTPADRQTNDLLSFGEAGERPPRRVSNFIRKKAANPLIINNPDSYRESKKSEQKKRHPHICPCGL
jgi:hypothetical protein